MRRSLAALFLGMSAMPGAALADIPLTVIGLPFEPETPRPVASTHPLYKLIEVGEIEGLPPTVKSSALNFIAAAKRSSINAGLRKSLELMNLLAPDAETSRGTLHVTWVGSDTPFKIGGKNVASVTMRYRLVRKRDNAQLFEREIRTEVSGDGNVEMRDNGIVRAAIAANFASAAYCMDHASLGTDPGDCTLTPKFAVTVYRVR